ncbi:uncharacterized protein LOC108048421 isoform X2 [Drosophila rhopaloa]|uniref:Uncharacterized protein LOC108048421 isoform X2 n=1 Tax=Drosophila rhopaloa TaxID=1041015 RepID=A0A6P4FG95_DRORH|nr:uncharacterized protein LOC108048421 isoform X2 [Drosophila rhopaloa]XP_016984544.1 uncharacterized protein LOC108048421 isoform X2 [Drosophila rhopaloa]
MAPPIATLAAIVFVTIVICGTKSATGEGWMHPRIPQLEVDAMRTEYIALERALWDYLAKTADSQNNKETQIRKVYDSHRDFDAKPLMGRTFEEHRYEVLNHYEWSLLERDLIYISKLYDAYKNTFVKQNSAQLDELAILTLSREILRNDNTISMPRIVQEIERVMVQQTLYYRAMIVSNNQICNTMQSAQQFVYSLYADIALTELKAYTMMEFSWMMLRVYGKGNYTQEAELMRSDYEKRTERTLKLLKDVMLRADRIVYRCDPGKHVQGVTYDQVTRLLQGYIENEVDLNNEETCRETCSFYQSTRSEGCFKELYCARQPRCMGRLYNCQFVDSDMWVCPSPQNSTRRYEFIEYENGRVLGQRGKCTRGTTKVDSWWRYLLWHCSYCFCLCDEQGLKSDRFFNLRDTIADVKRNRIVTGLRFVKKNRIFHLQIQEGELLPRGAVNQSTLEWKPVENYNFFDRDVKKGADYHMLSYESRSIDLDDVNTDDNSFVITGVRFRVVGAHLNLEAYYSEFDFKTGQLIQPESNSYWKSNDNTDVSGARREKLRLENADVSTRTITYSIPLSRHNQYIDFTNTGLDKDAAQSTVPFIDIQDVVSNPPVPLSGIGIYYKGRNGYGGFLGPKLITYDYTPHVQVPKNKF